MAFKNQDLSVIAYANGFTLWSYKTSDTVASMKKSGYFDDISNFARNGDMILGISHLKNSSKLAILYISEITSGKVKVTGAVV